MKGLPAIEVRNIAFVIPLLCHNVCIKYAPALRLESPGSEPSALLRPFTIGKSTPPALAPAEGIAGDIINSLITIE